jgi:CDP-glucose 4,6-dehydratase
VEDLMINEAFWRGRRVFLTGHTGFKGAWMSLVLEKLGAEVYGYALAPEDARDVFLAADVQRGIHHVIGDIRDRDALSAAVAAARPEVIIHMAAQALVHRSYADPLGTYATNVMGTAHLLESARHTGDVRAVIVVTSDKCYDNRERLSGYREDDRIGGRDPYSNSKACAELVTSAYRDSFFAAKKNVSLATARAGNVIGGGDWSPDRLIPDAVRAFRAKRPLLLRNPSSIRPWQHVLDPVLGYLLLAECLADQGKAFEGAWNFGPSASVAITVEEIVNMLVKLWGDGAGWAPTAGERPPEHRFLQLDCTKAQNKLNWLSKIDLENALSLTVAWYRALEEGLDMRDVSLRQIARVLRESNAVRPVAA